MSSWWPESRIDRDHTQWHAVIDHSKDSNGTWFLSRPIHFAWAGVRLVIRPAQERIFLYGKSFFICSQGKRSTISRINLYLVLRMCQPLCYTLYIQILLQFSQTVCEMEFFLNFLCHRCQLGPPDFHRWFTLAHTPLTGPLRYAHLPQFLTVLLLRLSWSQALCPHMLYRL